MCGVHADKRFMFDFNISEKFISDQKDIEINWSFTIKVTSKKVRNR